MQTAEIRERFHADERDACGIGFVADVHGRPSRAVLDAALGGLERVLLDDVGLGVGGQRAGGIDEMLERFPNITAADLKAGDMIAVSSSKNHTPDRITAIKVLAGVEPFVKAAQIQAAASGSRRVTQSLSIPGLDGVDIQ